MSSTASAITGTSNENEVVIKHHDPPTHQHSAASLLTSVAAASLAMTSIEASKELQQPMAATAVATEAVVKNNPLPPMTESTQMMETKCTQTKLDEDDHAAAALLLETASSAVAASSTKSEDHQQPPSQALLASNEPEPADVEGTTETKEEVTSSVIPQKEAELVNKPEQQPEVNPQASAEATTAGGEATESKGEMATWTSSTEVCPWEDEWVTLF